MKNAIKTTNSEELEGNQSQIPMLEFTVLMRRQQKTDKKLERI